MLGIVVRSKMINQGQKNIGVFCQPILIIMQKIISLVGLHIPNRNIIHKHDGCPISNLSERLSQNLLSFNRQELFLKIRTTIEFLVTDVIRKQNTAGGMICNETLPKVRVLSLNLNSYALAFSSSSLNQVDFLATQDRAEVIGKHNTTNIRIYN